MTQQRRSQKPINTWLIRPLLASLAESQKIPLIAHSARKLPSRIFPLIQSSNQLIEIYDRYAYVGKNGQRSGPISIINKQQKTISINANQ